MWARVVVVSGVLLLGCGSSDDDTETDGGGSGMDSGPPEDGGGGGMDSGPSEEACLARQEACGGNFKVGCDDDETRACIEEATSCGEARWCGTGEPGMFPDGGTLPALFCRIGCSGCSRPDTTRCTAACEEGPAQDCINAALSCEAVDDCF